MRKLLQLKVYSFLSSRWGMTFCVVGLFVTLNAFIQVVQLMLNTHAVPLVEWTDNIAGQSYKHIMCTEPIDVVYTWVNGSDPNHIKAVNELKKTLRDPAMLHCNSTQSPDKDYCFVDEDTQSRFIDNEELRYSLRSLEAFAPWIHHIYIVTNGQIPSWINVEHPRLTIITHHDIFVNKSHLPTFSSPSIETHLHRIPGLSSKFIYLNDDVMFGREIYPDDFYTHSSGQKVFLSWPVPNCAEGCPSNWIGDGYCDLACNVSACDFDAHDCDNYTGSVGGGSRWWTPSSNTPSYSDTSSRYKNYCAKGCPDTWIGDKYCDRMCKNVECGFDAGDCGVEDIFQIMYGVHVTWETTHIELPPGTPAVYFNLSTIVQSDTITDGSHDNAELVRTATISQKHKIMTLTFHRNISRQEVMLSVTAEHDDMAGNKTTVEKTFNISIDTTIIPSNDTSEDGAAAHASVVGADQPIAPSQTPQFDRVDGANVSAVGSTAGVSPEIITSPNLVEDVAAIGVNNTKAAGSEVNDKAGIADITFVAEVEVEDAGNMLALLDEDALNEKSTASDDTTNTEDTKTPNDTKAGDAGDDPKETYNGAIAGDGAKAGNVAQTGGDANTATNDNESQQNIANTKMGTLVEEVGTFGAGTDALSVDDATGVASKGGDTHNEGEIDRTIDLHTIGDVIVRTEEEPMNDGSKMKKEGGGEEPNKGLTGNETKEISSDPVSPAEIQEIANYGGVGARKLLSIPIEEDEKLAKGASMFQWEVEERKKEQLRQMELERVLDEERARLLRINKDYEAAVMKEFDELNENTQNGKRSKVWPWEHQKKLDEVREMHGGGRHLLDMYGDSLKHVNKLYNNAFGPSSRKVPAHMPHMIDRAIMEELQSKWPEEWEKTSTHSLRHPQDMQYAFAYFYYLIHARVEFNFTDVWEKELDVDADGKLNGNELRTLAVHLYGAPLKQSSLAELKGRLLNVCLALHPDSPRHIQHTQQDEVDLLATEEDSSNFQCPITLDVIQACNKTNEDIKKSFSKKLKYKHQLDGTDEVAFLMVGNNHTVMQGKLDGVRQKRQRFICLNDNINHSSSDARQVVNVLHDFYMSILPKRSSFELPENTSNLYACVEDLQAARDVASQRRRYTIIVGVVAGSTLLCAVYKCYIYASRADRRSRERRASRFLNT